MEARSIVVSATVTVDSTATAIAATTTSKTTACQAVNLPVGGVLYISGSDPITISSAAAYRPRCVPTNAPAIVGSAAGSLAGVDDAATSAATSATDLTGVTIDATDSDATSPQISDFRDPFYASTFPQCYALAATTVIAYTLVIMLLITPRSFLDGGVVVLGRRGFTNGGSGGKNIGGRPWLQKVAALAVAISLTIATADTFRVAENQYSWGIQNAKQMQTEVLDGTELKVIRIISSTFLWLAQAQTLIRLFPRQREKVIIKWTAFSLIVLDVVFDSLNSFLYTSEGRTFTDAIPALSYLFELALGVLYAAWVIYYSIMKKRYAFYHPKMRNICLVAMLSVLAVFVPVVFFILDISKPDFTGWGDYVLWVGAAAASVIVWEWVERIEALEREEKKDGILGREVFDGDEMLDIMPSDFQWPRRRRKDRKDDDPKDDASSDRRSSIQLQQRQRQQQQQQQHEEEEEASARATGRSRAWPTAHVWAARYLPSRYLPPSWKRDDRRLPADPEQAVSAGHSDDATAAAAAAAAATAAVASTAAGPSPSTGAQRLQPPLWPARPAPAVTPISRTDTASADSTVYVMRYHPVTDSNASHTASEVHPAYGSAGPAQHAASSQPAVTLSRHDSSSSVSSSSRGRSPRTTISFSSSQSPGVASGRTAAASPALTDADAAAAAAAAAETAAAARSASRWRTLAHALPFHKRATSQAEGSEHSMSSLGRSSARQRADDAMQPEETSRWDIRARLEDFAVTQAEKLRERISPTIDTTGLPVMVIPAPQRHGSALAQVLEEEEGGGGGGGGGPQPWPPQRTSTGTSRTAGTARGMMLGSLSNPAGSPAPGTRSDASDSASSADSPPAVVLAALSRASSSRESASFRR